MRARIGRRLAVRRSANAELCGVPLTEWQAMGRAERRDRLRTARWRTRAERRRG